MKIHPRLSGLLAFPLVLCKYILVDILKLNEKKVLIVIGLIGFILFTITYWVLSNIYYGKVSIDKKENDKKSDEDN